jgi:hypothetical protein
MGEKKISQKILCRSSSSFLLFLCVTKCQNFATKEKVVGKKCFLSANHPSIHPSMLHGVLVDRRSTWEESVSCPHTIHQIIHPAWYSGGGGKGRGGEGRELILESGSFFEEF